MKSSKILIGRVVTRKMLAAVLLVFATGMLVVMGQDVPPGAIPARRVGSGFGPGAVPTESAELARFDLEFRGGTPAELVAAISKSSGRRLNAIIPDEHADVRLPALRMTQVTAPQLFDALKMATMRTVTQVTGYSESERGGRRAAYQQFTTHSSFETTGRPVDDSTVWYFTHPQPPPGLAYEPPPTPKTCRFFQLAPYLKSYKVEDVTTAVQTAWKMLGEAEVPTLSFHDDTKLLIAVGEPDKVRLIDDVLTNLAEAPPAMGRMVVPGNAADVQREKVSKPAE
jgi:hypothetical protein